MSDKIPTLSGKEIIKVLEKIGYEVMRQRGSHIRLRDYHNLNHKPITVPNHKQLKSGLLRAILRDADLSPNELKTIIKK